MIELPNSFLARPIAHRALHDLKDGRPENSRAAIAAAIDEGYGIEIDLQLSLDDQPMVFHDYTLDRLTANAGKVRTLSASALARVALIGADEGIPTLAEVLDIVAGRVPLLIELKDQHGEMGDTDGALESAVAHALASYSGPAAVMSFNPNMVSLMAKKLPDIPRGLVTSGYDPEHWPELPVPVCDSLREIPDFDRAGCSFVSHHAIDLGRDRVQHLRAQGFPVLCWTIRSEQEETAARKLSENITFEGYLA